MKKLRKFWQIIHPRYWFIDFTRFTGWLFVFFVIRPKYYYESSKKVRRIYGNAILISNHRFWGEGPIMITSFLPRRMKIIAAKEVLEVKILGWMLKMLGCMAVDRNRLDLTSFYKCVDYLNEGGVMLIFPEGQLNKTDELLPFKAGVALMAYKAKAPIIPVYVKPPRYFYNRTHVIIGDPVYFNDNKRPSLTTINDDTSFLQAKMKSLQELLDKKMKEKK